MSFQFNFFNSKETKALSPLLNDEKEIVDSSDNKKDFSSSLSSCGCFEWKIPQEIILHPESLVLESEKVDEINFPGLLKRTYSDVLTELKDKKNTVDINENLNLVSITETSDIVPKQYEGGLKTWECSLDLLQILKEQKLTIKGLKVLEIGCGSGLPGVFCLKQCAADSIIFQDYNLNVLESVTLPNLILNSTETLDHKLDLNAERIKFFHGDWKDFSSKLSPKSIDLILTSETIYRSESYPWLLDIFSHCLSDSKDSKVLLAAKDYYFGLGGSVREFSNFSIARGWNVTCLRQFDNFEGVPRSILQLSRSGC